MTLKHTMKFITQMVASIYVSKVVNKAVGNLFDRAFGTSTKEGK